MKVLVIFLGFFLLIGCIGSNEDISTGSNVNELQYEGDVLDFLKIEIKNYDDFFTKIDLYNSGFSIHDHFGKGDVKNYFFEEQKRSEDNFCIGNDKYFFNGVLGDETKIKILNKKGLIEEVRLFNEQYSIEVMEGFEGEEVEPTYKKEVITFDNFYELELVTPIIFEGIISLEDLKKVFDGNIVYSSIYDQCPKPIIDLNSITPEEMCKKGLFEINTKQQSESLSSHSPDIKFDYFLNIGPKLFDANTFGKTIYMDVFGEDAVFNVYYNEDIVLSSDPSIETKAKDIFGEYLFSGSFENIESLNFGGMVGSINLNGVEKFDPNNIKINVKGSKYLSGCDISTVLKN